MTENFHLIKPNLKYSEEILDYKNEFNDPINGIEGSSMLTSFENIEDWLENLKLYESIETLPNKNHVPGVQFILIRKDRNKIFDEDANQWVKRHWIDL